MWICERAGGGEVQSNRWLRSRAAGLFRACLTLSLACLFAGAAQAQTLVSNTNLARSGGGATEVAGQQFTTGSHPTGYVLTAVEAWTFQSPLANPSGTYITINADNSGVPGSVLASLSNPGGTFDTSTCCQSFSNPATTVLDPDTDYWVVVNDETGSNAAWGRTDGNGEDSGSLPGWSIADGALEKSGGSWNSSVETDSMLLDIKGNINGNPDLTISGGEAWEGSAVPFTVTLDGALYSEVTVEYETSDESTTAGSDYTATSGTLTIAAGSTSATISIDATDDTDVEGDETLIVTLSNPSANADLGSPHSATGLILDNDSQTELNVTGDASAREGETLEFEVTLGHPVTADVTVDYTASIESGDTASTNDFTPTSAETLTISAGDTSATIEIAAVQDNRYETDETFTLMLSNPSSNAALGTNAAAEGTIVDDEVAALNVSDTTLDIDEGGTASFTVQLDNEPGAAVTVSISTGANSPLSFNATELEFTSDNWNAAQAVTVTAAHDNDAAHGTATITISTSGDDGYPQLGADISVAVTDDDAPNLVFSETPLQVPERSSVSYTVALATEPNSAVTVTIAPGADSGLTLDIDELDFTPQNWNQPQTVTVTAAADPDGDIGTATLTHTASGGDYADVSTDLPVIVPDTVAASIETSHAQLPALENWRERYYGVKLGVKPTGDVTFTVSIVTPTGVALSQSDLGIGSTDSNHSNSDVVLTFTPDNWNTNQRVYYGGRNDDDLIHETGYALRHETSGGGYDSAPPVVLPVLIEDDDVIHGFVLSRNTVNVAEGASANYTVRLSRRPSSAGNGNVTVNVAGANSDLTVNPDSLTFAREQWNDPQRVTVTAASQVAAGDEEITLTHSGSGGGYGSVAAQQLTVNIVRDVPMIPNQGVSVTSTPLHSSNTYARGETISVAVRFNRDVEVDTSGGEPTLSVRFGLGGTSAFKSFAYAGMPGNRRLDFEYVVQAGDSDSDGISIFDNALVLNGATIKATSDQRNADASGTSMTRAAGHTVNGNQTLAPANLTGLKLLYDGAELPLTPAFAANVTDYTVETAVTVEQATLEYTKGANATVDVLPADADGGTEGHQVAFTGAETEITLTVTRPPRPAGTYTVTVTRSAAGVSVTAPSAPVAVHLEDTVFTVTRSSAETTPLDVNLTLTQSGNFLPASKLSRTVTIPANQTSATLTFEPGDFTGGATADGTLTATVAAHSSYTVSGGSATADVVAADPAITIRPGEAGYVWLENSGQNAVAIVAEAAPRVTVPSGLQIGLVIQNRNGSARQGLDYASYGKSVQFAASDFSSQGGRMVASKTVDITLTNDSNQENDEDFVVQVVSFNLPDGVAVADQDGDSCSSLCEFVEVTILDDDSPPPQVTGLALTPAGGVLVAEWDQVTAADGYKLQWKSGQETFNDAATAGREADISSGSTTNHTLSSLNDGTAYTVRVAAIRSSQQGAWSAEATEDPALPAITVAGAKAEEGDAVVFDVSLSYAADSAVTVQYDTSIETGDTASADDFIAAAGATLTIDAGQTSATISIATTEDANDEGDETFTLTLSSPSINATLGTARIAQGTIEDDDTDVANVSSIEFTNVPQSGNYGVGDTIELSVTFDAAVDVIGAPRVLLSLDGTAASASYAAYDAGAGSDTVLVFRKTVTAADDDDTNGVEVAANALELHTGRIYNDGTTLAANISHGSLTGGAVLTRVVEDIEITSQPSVGAPAPEGIYGPGEEIEFTVTFSEAVTVSGAPNLKVDAGSTGTTDAGYKSGSGGNSLVFAWTVSSVNAGDGRPLEVPANFSGLALLTSGGLQLNGGSIVDSDGQAVNLRHGAHATDARLDLTGPALLAGAEGAVVDGTELVLTFERGGGLAEHLDETSVPLPGAFSVFGGNGGASNVEVDGDRVTLTLSSPAGHAQDVSLYYTGSSGDAPLKDLWGNKTPNFAGRTVRNDSPEPRLSVADATVSEGAGNAEFIVSLDIVSGEDVTVAYATADATAAAGSDYTAESGTLTIEAGEASGTIEVPVTDDAVGEQDETFTLTLSDAANAFIADDEATGTIEDNDGTPTLTVADAKAVEGNDVVFTVSLSPAAMDEVTVEYSTADGSATSDASDADGADYTPPAASAALTFSAGDTEKTVSIPTGDDAVVEGDETFTLTLANPSSNAVLGTARTATGTIENDDVDRPEISFIDFTGEPAVAYNLGDTIELNVIFDKPVAVTGAPRVRLEFPDSNRSNEYATYDATASGSTLLNFKRLVTGDDDNDVTGIRIAANGLELDGGTIRSTATSVDADLGHEAVTDGKGIDTRWVDNIAVTSTPTISASVTGDPVYGPGETMRFTVTFAHAVNVDATGGVPELNFLPAGASSSQVAAYESGHGTTQLVFAWTVPATVAGDGAGLAVLTNFIGAGYDATKGLGVGGGAIENAAGVAVNLRHGDFTLGALTDTTAPALPADADAAVVNGANLTLTFESADGVTEYLDANSEPAATDFAVSVAGSSRTVSGVDIDGDTVTLTLAPAAGYKQAVTLSYTPGTGPLQDLWENEAAAIAGRSVRNDSPQPRISIANATVQENGGPAEFSVTLDAASAETVSVDYATADDTAVAGTDYDTASGALEFAAGEVSKTVSVTIIDDSLAEGSETFGVTLSNASGAGIATGTATGTINDDEGAATLTVADASANEGDTLEFTVTLSAAASADVTVAYATADGTATSDSNHADGADYTAASGTLTITAGQTSGVIGVDTGDDSVYEPDETFTLTLSSPSANAALGSAKTATGTIRNNDAGSNDAALKSLAVSASGSTFSLSPTFAPGVFAYEAEVDNDVSGVTLAVEPNHGGATASISDDDDASTPNSADLDLAFGDNDFTVTVTAQDGVTTQTYALTVTRAPPVVGWEDSSHFLQENSGAVEVAVILSSAVDENVTVDYATRDNVSGSTPGEDYTAISGTLTFLPGETRKPLTVTILDDNVHEPRGAGNVQLFLSNLTGSAEFGETLKLLFVFGDNDQPPTAAMEDVSVDEDAGAMEFTLTLSHPVEDAGEVVFSVNSSSVGGTATVTEDYEQFLEFGSRSISIPDGETSVTGAITIIDDDIDEDDETITLDLRGRGSRIATNRLFVTGTILDDDERGVAVSESALPVPEGGSATYTVTLESEPTGNVTVTPSRASGDADVTVSDALTFTPSNWDTAQTVTVSAAEDADAANDTASIAHAVAGADYGANSVTADGVAVTVSDDETASTGITLTVNTASVGEGAGAVPVVVTGTLDGGARASATPLTVSVGAAADAAAEGADYSTVADFVLTIDAGEVAGTATFTLTPVDDGLIEASESLTVGGTATGLTVSGTTITITDNDARGVTVSESSVTVSEGGAETWTVVLDSQPTGNVTITPSRASGDADVTVSGALTFTSLNWNTEQTVTVSAAQDADAVDDSATISHGVAGADYGSNSVTAAGVAVTVTDDETESNQVALTVDETSVSEDAGATTVTVTGTLNSAPLTSDATVTVTVGDAGDSAAGGTDYSTVTDFTLTITAGQTTGTATFTLTPVDDSLVEDDESLTIGGSTTATGLSVSGTAITITDNDARGVTLSGSSVTVPEGGSDTYTIVLDSPPSANVTVTPSHASGDADVTVSGALTFTPTSWETEQTVTVSAAEDADAVNDTATISHEVAGADYGSNDVTAADVAVTVTDNETASNEIALTVNEISLGEDAGATTVTVTGTLNGAPLTADAVVTVAVGATGDAAVEGTDYSAVADFSLTITAGQTTGTATFTLTPADDSLVETDESLTVGGSTTVTELTTVSGTAITITDNDARGVTVSESDLTVSEGGSDTYTIALDSRPSANVTVTPSHASGDADVTVSSALTFTPTNWETEQTVTVSAAEDADAVNDTATISHDVAGADYGSNDVTAADVAVTVTDNETASNEIALTVNEISLGEDAGATTVTVTGTLNGAPLTADAAVTVTVGATDDAAVEGTDYTAVADFTLTITAGQTTGTATFTLTPEDDNLVEDGESLTVDGSTTVTGLTVTETTIEITDNDTRGVTVSETALTVTEGGSATYTIALDSRPTGNVTVAPSHASGDTDVTVSGALTFTPTNWETAQTVTVSAAEDADAAADTATISHAVTGADYGEASVTAADVAITVTDNETASSEIALSLSDTSLGEDAGATDVTVTGTLNGAPLTADAAVTVAVGATDDDAVEGTDYTAVADFTLTITAGQTAGTATFTLTPTDDGDDEDDESLTVSGSTTVASLTVTGTTLTIEDNDTAPARLTNLAFTNRPSGNVYRLGDTIEVSARFNAAVEVTGRPRVKLTFVDDHRFNEYALYDADASTETVLVFKRLVTGDDDNDTAGVRIPKDGLQRNGGTIRNKGTTVDARIGFELVTGGPNVNTRWVQGIAVTSTPSVPETVTGDPVYGPGETVRFTVTFSNAVEVDETDGSPQLKFRSGSNSTIHSAAYEGGTGTTELVFAWTVPASVAGDGAALVIPTNVRGIGLDGGKGLTLSGGAIENANGVNVNIRHGLRNGLTARVDTTGPVLASAAEGATVDGTELTLNFERAAGVADHLDEDSAPAPGDFEVAVAGTARSVTGVTLDAAAVTLTLASPVGHAQAVTVGYTPGTDAISDRWGNDAGGFTGRTVRNDSPEPALSIAGVTVAEDAGTAEFTVSLDLASGEEVSVDYATSDDTAEAGSDYTAATGTLTFAVGESSKTIDVAVTDDSVVEAGETFGVTLSNATNATIGTAAATGTITDNDSLGVTVSETALSVTEGGSATYTVVLNSQPTDNVTVTPSNSSGDADVTVSGALTFSTTNWNTEQTVTVSAAQDADAENDTATLSHAVTGADYGENNVTAADVAVTVGDDETASNQVALTVNRTSLAEGAGATLVTVTGTLNGAPLTADAAVTVSVGATSDDAAEGEDYVTVNDLTLTITAGQTAGTATFTLTPVDDDADEGDESLTVGGTTTATGLGVTGTTIAITDDDTRGVTVSESSLPVPEGGTATYAIALDSEPSGDVTVTPSRASGDADVTVSGALTFTPSNWNTQQTVTVSAAEDADAANDAATISHAVAGADYASVQADDVDVIVNDDDTASTQVTLTVSETALQEDAGATAVTVTAELDESALTSDLDVTVSVGAAGDTAAEGTDYAQVDDLTLTITAGQTSGTATFTLTPTDDAIDDDGESLTVGGTAADASFTVNGATIGIEDDDERGVTVSASALAVVEGGSSTYTIVLDSQPTGDVTVTPSRASGDEGVTASGALTFAPPNWNTEQTVTVSAAEDNDAEPGEATVSHVVAGADYGDNGVAAQDVEVTVSDNETASTAIALSLDRNAVDEDAGAVDVIVTATLNGATMAADATVTVTVGAAADEAAEGGDYEDVADFTLTITAGEATGAATFTLTPVDDSLDEADESLSVIGATDAEGIETVNGAALTITDNDTRGVRLSETSLDLNEGETKSYTVVLDTQPTGDVSVQILVSADEDSGAENPGVTVEPQELTFTPEDWDDPRTVTATAEDDIDGDDGAVTLDHAVSGADYAGETVDSLPVAVKDDEAAAAAIELRIEPSTMAEDFPGAEVTVTGLLDGAPRTADTEVFVSVGAPGDSAAEGADYAPVVDLTLTIAAGETAGVTAFTLIPTDDGVDESDETIAVTGSTVETALTVIGTTLTLTDDDTRGVTLSGTSLEIDEGGTGSYTLALESQPTADVTVSLRVRGDSAVTVSPETLVFTPSNWGNARTVTVRAAPPDDSDDDGAATVEHALSGGDYSSVTAGAVTVTVNNVSTNAMPQFAENLPTRLDVTENTAADTAIGAPFTATDDDGDELTYGLAGADAGSFSIDSDSGQLRALAALDHESKIRYTVIVTVEDGRGGTARHRLRLTVTDEDEQPGVPAAPTVLAAQGSTTSLRLRWAEPDTNGGPAITGYELQYRAGEDGDWLNYRHTGTSARATIQGLGQATAYQARVRALNGESPGEWSEPGAGRTGRPDNAAPVFDDGLPALLAVAENTGAGVDLGAPFTASDDDGDTLTWLLEGAGRHVFAIDSASGQLRTRAPLDHESNPNWPLTVKTDDGNGGSDSLTITIQVADVEEQAGTLEAPVAFAARGSSTKLEAVWNAPDANGGPAIAAYEIQYRTDEDSPWNDHRHRGTGTRTVIDWLEPSTAYEVRVRALNREIAGEWSEPGEGRTGEPVNSPPRFDDGLPVELTVDENLSAGTEIGAPFAATDSDGDTLTWLLGGAGASAFSIDPESGLITTKAELDHESRARYRLSLRVVDGKGGADSIRVTVNVADVDEQAPALSAPVVLAAEGTTTSLDARWRTPYGNGGPTVTAYEVQYREGADGEWIDHAHEGAGTSAVIAGLSASAEYQIRVRALNGELPGDWSEAGTGSTGRTGNSDPAFSAGLSATIAVNENTPADSDIGAPFTAADDDGDTLIWLLGGAGRGVFAIDADSGQLRTRAPLDHETRDSWPLTVQVNDGAGGAASIDITVTIADVAEQAAPPTPPLVLATAGTTTGLDLRWRAPDANGGPPVTGYELQYRADGDSEWTGHAHEGAGTTAAIAGLAEETGYQARVRALNGETPSEWSEPGAGNTGREDNRAPAFADDTATRSIAEDSEAGEAVGAPVTAADPDRDSLTYTLAGDDAAFFDIDPQTGQILTRAALDYETKPAYSLTVTASDGAGGADSVAVAIELIDALEAQAALGPAAPTGVTLGQTLTLDTANNVQAELALRWNAHWPEQDGAETAWIEFRLGRYPESGNGISPAPFQCAGNRPFEPDGWRRIPASGPGGANAGSYRFDARTLGCHVLPDTFELRAQVRAVSAGESGSAPRPSAPSTEARMRDAAPRVIGLWLDSTGVDALASGDEIAVVAAFTEPVRVRTAGEAPTIEIEIGGEMRQAAFAAASRPPAFRDYGSGHIGSRLEFRYVLQDGDDPAAGIVVPANAISISGGAVVDATGPGGHAADLRHGRTAMTEGSQVVAPPPEESLTASFTEDATPAEHDGETPFSAGIDFGDSGSSSSLDGLNLSASSFLVTHGRITDVSRREEGDNRYWSVTVAPESKADVSISLGPTFDCEAEGAVCAADGRRLANNIHAVVKGPPGLSVADAAEPEGPDAAMEFVVTLSRALTEAVTVDYATVDGTAVAGADYTAASGTLTFAAGEIVKTVAVEVLDDSHDDDGETFRLILSDPEGGNAYLEQNIGTGTIRNSDPMPKAWITRFGRTVSDHVVGAIQDRMDDERRESHFTLGGLRVDGLFEPGAAGAPAGALDGRALPGEPGWRPTDRLFGGNPATRAGAFPGGQRGGPGSFLSGQMGGAASPGASAYPASNLADGGAPAGGYGDGRPDMRQLFMGSSFFYSKSNAASEDPDAAENGVPGDWSAWGSTASTHFRGQDGALSLDGEVFTGMVGADARWNRWLGGVVIAHSVGEGGFTHAAASGGKVRTALTSVHPFAQYTVNERTSVWGTVGYGLGALSLTPEGENTSVDTDLGMTMAAFGGRGVLSVRKGAAGAFELAVRSDAMFTETESGASENLLSASGATSRMRVVLEGKGSLPLGGGVLTPTLEAGLRYDGGDAETGAGLEIGGGLGYSAGRLSAQMNARVLAAHEDAAYEEWGFSSTLRYDAGAGGRGLGLSLGTSWGAAQSGVRAMWDRQPAQGLSNAHRAMTGGQRFETEFGYGILTDWRKESLWTPFVGLQATRDGGDRMLRFGLRLKSGERLETLLEFGRRLDARGVEENAVGLRGTYRW